MSPRVAQSFLLAGLVAAYAAVVWAWEAARQEELELRLTDLEAVPRAVFAKMRASELLAQEFMQEADDGID